MHSALEEQRAAIAQQNLFIQRDQTKHAANLANFEQALGSVRRDRESMPTEVQTISAQLTEALEQVGSLNDELEQTRRMMTECSFSTFTCDASYYSSSIHIYTIHDTLYSHGNSENRTSTK